MWIVGLPQTLVWEWFAIWMSALVQCIWTVAQALVMHSKQNIVVGVESIAKWMKEREKKLQIYFSHANRVVFFRNSLFFIQMFLIVIKPKRYSLFFIDQDIIYRLLELHNIKTHFLMSYCFCEYIFSYSKSEWAMKSAQESIVMKYRLLYNNDGMDRLL